jgi:polyphosphate kinase
LAALIEREISYAKAGREAALTFKMNALVDQRMIRALYRASAAGVKIQLLVRGICCLRPGLPGISENIEVISIVGRFLEHSRIFYFRNDGEEEVYIGSADLMPRNIDHRVEVLVPIRDPEMIRHLRDDVLELYLADNVKGRRMVSNGSYTKRRAEKRGRAVNSQEALLLPARSCETGETKAK